MLNKFNLNILFVVVLTIAQSSLAKTTCDRITEHGYPCESHTVPTSDGYLLTMFRIPYSHRSDNQNVGNKSAVLLMHGIQCSSDIWVLNGPNDGLPFLLADAGNDVWLANVRGTIYSRRHQSLSTTAPAFWEFSWDEIGQYDLPAKIDYILSTNGQQSIHYVAHSQGTRIFMILLSSKTTYSQKVRTAHMLGPGVFLCHLRSRLPVLIAPLLGRPNILSSIFSGIQTTGVGGLIRAVAPGICKQPRHESTCVNVLNSITGRDSPYLNRTLLPDFFETTPAGSSARQTLHYLQTHLSCELKAFDLGYRGNMLKYGHPSPPPYNLANVQPETPIDLYFSDNDYLATLEDVRHLADILGYHVSLHRLKLEKFNHFDFLLAQNIKSVINDCVVDKIQKYEGRFFNGSLCDSFRDKAF